MRKFTSQYVALLFAAATVFSVGCDDNDEIAVDPNAEYDVTLDVKEGDPATLDAPVAVDANTKSTILAKVIFTSTTKSMKRLYITQNVAGQGETIYEPTEDIDLKGDGAVDLEKGNGLNFEYGFHLPVPSGVSTGTVVYKFWTTTGNGDFRDMSQRLAVGPGTITLKYGTGLNPAAKVKAFSAKILAAPLADGTSPTFVSLANGSIYKINEGAEFAAFWDFGYYNTQAEGASLTSTSYYDTAFPYVEISKKSGIAAADLNNAYFATSTVTSAEFDAVTTSENLKNVAASNRKITELAKGDIVQFTDNYGKKGLIRVVDIVGDDGSNDYIKIDIKVQP